MTDTASPQTQLIEYKNLQALGSIKLFELIGVKGSPEEETAAANQLVDGLWQEWINAEWENLPDEAIDAFEEILNKGKQDDKTIASQVSAVVEKHMPNAKSQLEHRLLELKAEMLLERIDALRERHADKTDDIAKLDQAENFIDDGEWIKAVETVNQLQA